MVSHVDDDGLLSLHKLGSWAAVTLVDQRVEVRVSRRPGAGRRRQPREEQQAVVERPVRRRRRVEPRGGARARCARRSRRRDRPAGRARGRQAGLEVVRQPGEPLGGARGAAAAGGGSAGLGRRARRVGAGGTELRGSPDECVPAGSRRRARPRRHLGDRLPGAGPHEHGDHPLGSGAAILRGPAVHPRSPTGSSRRAQRLGDPHTIEVANVSLTDADHVYIAGAGVATCIASIPVRRVPLAHRDGAALGHRGLCAPGRGVRPRARARSRPRSVGPGSRPVKPGPYTNCRHGLAGRLTGPRRAQRSASLRRHSSSALERRVARRSLLSRCRRRKPLRLDALRLRPRGRVLRDDLRGEARATCSDRLVGAGVVLGRDGQDRGRAPLMPAGRAERRQPARRGS